MDKIKWVCYFVVLVGTWILYIQNYQRIIGKNTLKKLRIICKREFRNEAEQIELIVRKFVDEYAEKNGIDWKKEL